MNNNMTEYTQDVENKLEKAYAAVGGAAVKKYGFEKLAARNVDNSLELNQS